MLIFSTELWALFVICTSSIIYINVHRKKREIKNHQCGSLSDFNFLLIYWLKSDVRWPWRLNFTSDHQTNPFIWFLDPRNIFKWYHLLFWGFKFFSIFNFYSIFFLTLWAENVPTQSWKHLGVYFVPYNLPKNL